MARFLIDTSLISDWSSFHQVFQDVMRFFDGYGRNMDAWIDCMTDLHGERALSDHRVPNGEQVELVLLNAEDSRSRCPKIVNALFDCTAFVNGRYHDRGEPVRVMLIPDVAANSGITTG